MVVFVKFPNRLNNNYYISLSPYIYNRNACNEKNNKNFFFQ